MSMPSSARSRPSQPDGRALKLLGAVLPSSASAFDATLQHSRRALKLVDRWLQLDCIGIIESGQPIVLSNEV